MEKNKKETKKKYNTQNLKPFKKGELSSEEAKRRGANGAKKREQKKLENKLFSELFIELLQQPVLNQTFATKLENMGLDPKSVSNKTAMTIAMLDRALIHGDTKAYELISAQIGEKPDEKINIDVNKKLEDYLHDN